MPRDEFRPHEVCWTPAKITRLWDFQGTHSAFDADRFALHCGDQIIKWAGAVIPFSQRTVVDYGCGAGYLLKSILALTRIKSCIGVDCSPDSLRRAEAVVGDDLRFKGVVLSQELPVGLPDDYADVVFMLEVIEHLEDAQLQGALREVNRLLKTGGYLVATTPNKEDLDAKKRICPDCGAIFHPKQHIRSWSAQTLTDALHHFGFKSVSVEQTNWTYRGFGFLARLAMRGMKLLPKQYAGARKHLAVIATKAENLP